MALSVEAFKIYGLITADNSDLTKKLSESSQKTVKFANELGSSLKSIGRTMSVALTLPITAFAIKSVAAFEEHQRAVAQTEAVIKSTGNAAQVTSLHINELTKALGRAAAVDDDLVRGGANVLLTFTNVSNGVGEAQQIFDQATEAALDLSVALQTDMASAATVVGKALNDPIQGLSALTRLGIQFTEEQKRQIEVLVLSGDLYAAQGVILDQLTTKFGGSAEAQVTATARMKVALDDLAETFGTVLAPYVAGAADALDDLTQKFVEASPQAQKLVAAIAGITAVAGPAINIGGSLATMFATLIVTAGSTAAAMEALRLAMIRTLIVVGALVAGMEIGNWIRRTFIDAGDLTEELTTELSPALVELHDAAGSSAEAVKDMTKKIKEMADQDKNGIWDFTFALEQVQLALEAGVISADEAIDIIGNLLPDNFRAAGASAEDFVNVMLASMRGTVDGANMARVAIQNFAGMTGQALADWEAEVKGHFNVASDAFSSLEIDAKTTASNINDSLLEQLTGWRDFRKNLKELAKRGVSQDALKYLREQGAEMGGQIAAALVKGSDKDLKTFNVRFKHSLNVQDTLNEAVDATTTKLNSMATAYEAMARRVELAMARVRAAILGTGLSPSQITMAYKGIREMGAGATGAIVRQPTLSLIGEAGPEAVVPLNQMPGASPLPGGGGSNLSVSISLDRKVFTRQQEYLVRASGF